MSPIDAVLARMSAIDTSLPPNDGVGFFNRLYLQVTRNVAARLGTGFFGNDDFIAKMDIVFANYYFRALDSPAPPKCWAPLFESRGDARIPPLGFALAGMNAHINHDLAHTVLDLATQAGRAPARGSAEHADYLKINDVLASTVDEVKPMLFRGALEAVDGVFGRADDAAEIFSIAHAREAAWTAAETFWVLRSAPELTAAYEASLDRLVGMSSRAMLALARA